MPRPLPAPLPPPAEPPSLPAAPPSGPSSAASPPAGAGPLADVAALLESSRPRRSALRARLLMPVLAVLVLVPLLDTAARPAVAVLIAVVAGGGGWLTVYPAVLRLRREAAAVDTVEAQVALRRVPDAAVALHRLLARPMRAPDHRLRAMVLLGAVLSRLDRGDEAIAVYDALLGPEGLTGPAAVVVKLARAMAMLTADRLYDADRAIADLRRTVDRDDTPPALGPALAGLRLLELYRDVKTNHVDDAMAGFQAHFSLLRDGLGHRVAEAHALAAVACHRLGRPADAAARFADATALAPLSDLVRRYPDLWPLTQAYPATEPPR